MNYYRIGLPICSGRWLHRRPLQTEGKLPDKRPQYRSPILGQSNKDSAMRFLLMLIKLLAVWGVMATQWALGCSALLDHRFTSLQGNKSCFFVF